jgi:hypothetical protein
MLAKRRMEIVWRSYGRLNTVPSSKPKIRNAIGNFLDAYDGLAQYCMPGGEAFGASELEALIALGAYRIICFQPSDF